jgi:hypothetical protein
MMIETPGANPNEFVLDQLSLFYVFQYMIGNVDWGTGTSHNVKVIRKDHQYYPVPYDFDWTGLVDAWYAGPNRLTEGLHDSVRERLYWGVCLSGIDYQAVFGRFNEQQDAVMAFAPGIPGLSEENVGSATDYLREFYEIINDERKSDRAIVRACRPWL